MKLQLIRHGRTDANSAGRLSCDQQEPLNDTGLEQAKMLGHYLETCSISTIWCSPLLRAVQTVKPFLDQSTMKATLLPELAEGQLNLNPDAPIGSPSYDAYSLPIELLPYLSDDSIMTAPFANETIGQFRARVKALLTRLGDSESDDTILVITHGHFIRELLNMFMGTTNYCRFPVGNCSETLLEITSDRIVHHINKNVI